jgi:hypothetical protein
MIKALQKFFSPSIEPICEEFDIYSILMDIQDRLKKLEIENIEFANALYECENRIEAKIEGIHPVVYNIQENKSLENFTLGE